MRVKKSQVLCVLLGITLAAAVFFVEGLDSPLLSDGRLLRNSYGQGERQQEIFVEGLLEDKVLVDVPVGERQYSEENAKDAMDQAAAELFRGLSPFSESEDSGEDGESAGAEGISTILVKEGSNMAFPTWLDEYGISVEWLPEDTGLIGADGTVYETGCPEEGIETSITARLSTGSYTEEYELPVRISPQEWDVRKKALFGFQTLLREADEDQRLTEYLVLPKEYGGKQLSYHVKRDRDFLLFPCFGIAAAFLIPLSERQKEKEKRQMRERQMMLDYPEIVSKLVVFSGAGLPVRKAWERIVLDYEKSGEKREAYQEMEAAYHMMQRGVPELRAYGEFGKRCHSLPYRKLAGLLEQNIKNGSEGLRAVLETEMEAAFEQKKNLARKMGEEASTKLLLPLFLMLFIVMAMVSVPAFLSFGIG